MADSFRPPQPSRPSPFGQLKSSISRKKPAGLDISPSIPKPSIRGASVAVVTGPDSAADPNLGSAREGASVTWITESDHLRDEIARLQLSSKSSSFSYDSDSESPSSNQAALLSTSAVASSSVPTVNTPSSHAAPPPRPPRRRHPTGDATGSSTKESHGASALSSKEATPSRSTSTSSHRKHKLHANGSRRRKDRHDDDLVKDEDLEVLQDLGSGNGGTVVKVWNKKRKVVMAKKLILIDAKPSMRKQILRELQIMNDCSSPFIVSYYGCFPVDVHVALVMEFMDVGSLDSVYRATGMVPIGIVGKIAEAVLRGLMYLYDSHRIIHRDIKPSNILLNSQGEIKLADFGVAGELINSIANTFVGTSTYMSPERIQGSEYSIKSDVWSLGISLVELAHGRFPFADAPDSSSESDEHDDGTINADSTLPLSANRPSMPSNGTGASNSYKKGHRRRGVSLGGGDMTMSILDLLQHIVNEPAPRLVDSRRQSFPAGAVSFVDACLNKDPKLRKSPRELLQYDWIVQSKVTQEDVRVWTADVFQKMAEKEKERERQKAKEREAAKGKDRKAQ